MTIPTPRVVVPSAAAKGEVFQVKTIINHQMETGLRRDDHGDVIPRKIINRFVCRYGDAVVFSADFHEAVAANPYLEFYVRATESARMEFVWEEDGGGVYSLSHDLAVS